MNSEPRSANATKAKPRIFTCSHVWQDGAPVHRIIVEDEDGCQDVQILCGPGHHEGTPPVVVRLQEVLRRFPDLKPHLRLGGYPYVAYLPPGPDEPVRACRSVAFEGRVPARVGRDDAEDLVALCEGHKDWVAAALVDDLRPTTWGRLLTQAPSLQALETRLGRAGTWHTLQPDGSWLAELTAQDLAFIEKVKATRWRVISVLNENPPVAYTVGLCALLNLELIIFSDHAQVHQILNNVAEDLLQRDGEIPLGTDLTEILQHHPVRLLEVEPLAAFRRWACWASWYASRVLQLPSPPRVLQVIYPDASGRWPWDLPRRAVFRKAQPLLAH